MGWFSFLAAKGSVRASKGMQECATGEVWLLKLNSRHYKTNLKNVPFPLLTLILTNLCKKDLYILPFFRLLPSSHINAPVLNCRDEERVLRQWLVIPGSMKSPIGLWYGPSVVSSPSSPDTELNCMIELELPEGRQVCSSLLHRLVRIGVMREVLVCSA